MNDRHPYDERPWVGVIATVCFGLMVLGVLVGAAVSLPSQQQAQRSAVQTPMVYLPKQASQPQAFVLKRTVTEGVICAERYDSDYVDCRPVDEFRKWARERPAQKK